MPVHSRWEEQQTLSTIFREIANLSNLPTTANYSYAHHAAGKLFPHISADSPLMKNVQRQLEIVLLLQQQSEPQRQLLPPPDYNTTISPAKRFELLYQIALLPSLRSNEGYLLRLYGSVRGGGGGEGEEGERDSDGGGVGGSNGILPPPPRVFAPDRKDRDPISLALLDYPSRTRLLSEHISNDINPL